MQDLIRKLPGVISTRVGYTGGDVPNATYRNHGSHAEAIEIIFDPEKISYRDLLEFFFQIHDPTTKNRQGNDIGTSYRSAIFYLDDEQKQIAEDTIADVDASGLWPGKVVTEVTPAGPFWEAEPEHQDYLERYPNGYTCHFVRPGWKLPAPRGQGHLLIPRLYRRQHHQPGTRAIVDIAGPILIGPAIALYQPRYLGVPEMNLMLKAVFASSGRPERAARISVI